MAWAKPEYSRAEVNAASKIWLSGETSDAEKAAALLIVNNWRGIHAFPLNTFQMGLRRRGQKFTNDFVVAQRIKRLSSIELKLSLRSSMKLTQMQDIGGCRAILRTVAGVRSMIHSFKSSDLKHKLLTEDDYINSPKLSGYRGIHLVYAYNSDRSETYNDLKVEVQIRSQMQHAWATSVEVVGTLVDQALKSSLGDPGWLRFFQLMSSELARREGEPLVPDTPEDVRQARVELIDLINTYKPVQRLESYRDALNYIEHAKTGDHYYIMHLQPRDNRLTIESFPKAKSTKASDRYLEIEEGLKRSSDEEAVLVSVDSITSLRKAYPNYFFDTQAFVHEVQRAVRLSARQG